MEGPSPAWCWVLSPAFTDVASRVMKRPRSGYASLTDIAGFYDARNLVFFHPEDHQANLLSQLTGFEQVICNIGDPLTLEDAEGQAAKAESLSRLSLDFPNVVGGLVDDFSSAIKEDRMSVDLMKRNYEALKSTNASLQLFAVAYTMHFDLDLSAYLPYVDVINLWVWKACDLVNLDEYMTHAERLYPGKPIHLGLYLHDYGDTRDTLPMDLLQFQLKRAEKYLEDGRIEGFHLLGSYLTDEMRTEQAQWVADRLADGAR